MTDQLSPLAVQNAPLLRALQQGPAATPTELAERAGVVANNLHRKLDALADEGLIVRDPDGPKHIATLTEAAERALMAVQVYEGGPVPMGAGRSMIPFSLIDAWIGNPRTQFDPASTEEMAQSIGDKGVLQALIVRPKGDRFEVVIGERRRRGARLAVERGWQPDDFAVPCEVRDLTDDEALEIAGVENLQREDMHWMDEAKWYQRLADRLSGPQIERLVGGQRKKRSIQDYIKIARELSAEDLARTYLDEKHKDYLPYVRARDMVGEKKERPALDLTPKLKLTLLELIYAGTGPAQLGATVETRLHAAPVGGPMGTLSTDRKLISFGFDGARNVVVRIKITEDIAKYLDQVGWHEDFDALYQARVAVVGELQASTFGTGEYVTPELNAPKAKALQPQITFSDPTPAPQLEPDDLIGGGYDDDEDEGDADDAPLASAHEADNDAETLPASQRRALREIAARSIHKYRLVDGWVQADEAALSDPDFQGLWDLAFVSRQSSSDVFRVALTLEGRDYLRSHDLVPEGKSANSCTTPWLRTDYEAEISATPSAAAAPAPAPTPIEQAPPTLPPMLQIVIIELAHRISAQGIERGPGTWATEVLADYYKDQRGMQLVQQHRMLAFMPMGHKTLAALTKRGREWLQTHASVAFTAADQARLDDAALMALQRELGFTPPAGAYATSWLNDPPAEAAPAPEPAPLAAPQSPAPTPASGRDEFSRQILAVTAEARVMSRLAGALREAATAFANARTRKLTAAEIDKLTALIDSALEAAQPHLNEAPAHV